MYWYASSDICSLFDPEQPYQEHELEMQSTCESSITKGACDFLGTALNTIKFIIIPKVILYLQGLHQLQGLSAYWTILSAFRSPSGMQAIHFPNVTEDLGSIQTHNLLRKQTDADTAGTSKRIPEEDLEHFCRQKKGQRHFRREHYDHFLPVAGQPPNWSGRSHMI